ncbi:MAG TPA: class I SAM-dependent RNA methyltransferase, partial [Pyrinomonadaceae bacterium]|nr:class I SAM-dependent RNA methyltransferase [Pyrinomonadaceae bacterium]
PTTPKAPTGAEELEVTIERLLPGGVGFARAGERTLLVGLAAPGDRLRVRIERVRGRVAFASIVEVLAPSPVRVEPPCPYFGRCGGCDFQQLNYEAQLAAKVEIIRDCLRRIARIEPPAEIPITPSPAVWQYRSRAQWQFERGGRRLGYFERGTHNVCDVAVCPVVIPALQETLERVRAELKEHPRDARTGEFEAVAGDSGVMLWPPLDEETDDALAREQTRSIGGETYRFGPDCFFQINHTLLEPLITEATRDAEGERALDLYCGVGLFTLPLARRFRHVVGVEGNPSATRYARRNLSDAGLTHAEIETSAVGDWLTRRTESLPPIDFILLDPPRAGAERETIDAINALAPRHISYVSCDPATLARDLHLLFERGYRLTSLRAFDLFPQTHHVETVAHLNLSLSDTKVDLQIHQRARRL